MLLGEYIYYTIISNCSPFHDSPPRSILLINYTSVGYNEADNNLVLQYIAPINLLIRRSVFEDSIINFRGQIIGPTLFGPTLQQTDLSTDRMVSVRYVRFLIMNHSNETNLKII